MLELGIREETGSTQLFAWMVFNVAGNVVDLHLAVILVFQNDPKIVAGGVLGDLGPAGKAGTGEAEQV